MSSRLASPGWPRVAILFGLLLAGCSSGKNPGGGDSTPRVTTITVALAASIAVGGAALPTAVARDQGGATMSGVAFTWASSNPGVATVIDGMAVGVAARTAGITASSGGVTSTRRDAHRHPGRGTGLPGAAGEREAEGRWAGDPARRGGPRRPHLDVERSGRRRRRLEWAGHGHRQGRRADHRHLGHGHGVVSREGVHDHRGHSGPDQRSPDRAGARPRRHQRGAGARVPGLRAVRRPEAARRRTTVRRAADPTTCSCARSWPSCRRSRSPPRTC